MDFNKLLSKFIELCSTVQSLVTEFKKDEKVKPATRLFARWKTDEVATMETGVTPSHAHLEYVEKDDWFRSEQAILEQLKTHRTYSEFRDLLASSIGKDVAHEIERATSALIGRTLQGQAFDPEDALRFLLSALRDEAVSAWSDIDVHGMKLKTKSITLNLGERRLTFRQLDLPDFEHEFLPGLGPTREKFGLPPGLIIRVEIKTTRGWELQLEALKILTLLRLIAVCSVDFGQQAQGTKSLFPFLGGHGIGGTLRSGQIRRGCHEVILEAESQAKLQRFWEYVEPRLPVELYDCSNKKDTAVTIAFERYCDSLFASHPIERKVAACMMGLEALYFHRDEIQDLSYRLSLRVSKALSKLAFNPEEVQQHIKTGYRIRSLHVHGSHLSAKERTAIQKSGISSETLAAQLLNYLRISILHFVCSGQQKAQFLDLIEASLVSREKEDVLSALLAGEGDFLCMKLP